MKLKHAALLPILIASVSPALSQQLKQTNFEDGTGSIGLPAGWQIQSAYRGAVQATGPNGAGVVMKMPWAIIPAGSSLNQLACEPK